MDLLKNTGILLGVLLFLTCPIMLGQDHDHDHDHSTLRYEHPKNEIGFGNYLSYMAGEQEFAYSMHIHYLRSFEGSRFGTGLGYEQIFDEHGHRSLTIIGAFRSSSPLVLSLAPGICHDI